MLRAEEVAEGSQCFRTRVEGAAVEADQVVVDTFDRLDGAKEVQFATAFYSRCLVPINESAVFAEFHCVMETSVGRADAYAAVTSSHFFHLLSVPLKLERGQKLIVAGQPLSFEARFQFSTALKGKRSRTIGRDSGPISRSRR